MVDAEDHTVYYSNFMGFRLQLMKTLHILRIMIVPMSIVYSYPCSTHLPVIFPRNI